MEAPVFCKIFKQKLEMHLFMDIFTLKDCPTHGSCDPAGWLQAEYTTPVPGCPCVASGYLIEPHSLSRSWCPHLSSGDNGRSGDTVELSNLSEIRILMRVRGTWAGGGNLEAEAVVSRILTAQDLD